MGQRRGFTRGSPLLRSFGSTGRSRPLRTPWFEFRIVDSSTNRGTSGRQNSQSPEPEDLPMDAACVRGTPIARGRWMALAESGRCAPHGASRTDGAVGGVARPSPARAPPDLFETTARAWTFRPGGRPARFRTKRHEPRRADRLKAVCARGRGEGWFLWSSFRIGHKVGNTFRSTSRTALSNMPGASAEASQPRVVCEARR